MKKNCIAYIAGKKYLPVYTLSKWGDSKLEHQLPMKCFRFLWIICIWHHCSWSKHFLFVKNTWKLHCSHFQWLRATFCRMWSNLMNLPHLINAQLANTQLYLQVECLIDWFHIFTYLNYIIIINVINSEFHYGALILNSLNRLIFSVWALNDICSQ